MYEKVSFRAAEDYSSERVFKAVESVFRDINAHELLGSAKKVVIKPNLVIRRPPESCATTHPAVLAAVLRLLEPYDAGGYRRGDPWGSIQRIGAESALPYNGCGKSGDRRRRVSLILIHHRDRCPRNCMKPPLISTYCPP